MRVGLIILGVALWIAAGIVFVGVERAYLIFVPVSVWLTDATEWATIGGAIVAATLALCSLGSLRLSSKFENKRNLFELTEEA